MSAMQTCTKCGQTKPATREHFNRHHRRGLRSDCRSCQGRYRREYGNANRESLNAAAADYRGEHRGDLALKERVRRQAMPVDEKRSRNRAYSLKHEYGITVEQYDELFEAQGGVCALCSRPPQRRALAVDHDHETGVVRGLLCGPCNTALGRFGDNEDGVLTVLAYLRGAA